MCSFRFEVEGEGMWSMTGSSLSRCFFAAVTLGEHFSDGICFSGTPQASCNMLVNIQDRSYRIKILKHVALPLGRTHEKRRQPSCHPRSSRHRELPLRTWWFWNWLRQEIHSPKNNSYSCQQNHVIYLDLPGMYIYICTMCVVFTPTNPTNPDKSLSKTTLEDIWSNIV